MLDIYLDQFNTQYDIYYANVMLYMFSWLDFHSNKYRCKQYLTSYQFILYSLLIRSHWNRFYMQQRFIFKVIIITVNQSVNIIVHCWNGVWLIFIRVWPIVWHVVCNLLYRYLTNLPSQSVAKPVSLVYRYNRLFWIL